MRCKNTKNYCSKLIISGQKYIKMDGMNEKLMPKYFIGSAHRENTDGKRKS